MVDRAGLSVYHREALDPSGGDSQARVVRLVPPNVRVLDLGCSSGVIGGALQDKGCVVAGVDNHPPDLAVAGARLSRVAQVDLDIVDLHDVFPGETFDMVVAADVLEHLREPERILHQVRDMLTEDGSIVFSIPNVAHASVRLALWQGRFPYESFGILDRTHLRMFTIDSVRALFADCGFVISHLERTTLPVALGVEHRPVLRSRHVRRMLRDPEALTLQFIGTARKTATPPPPGDGPSPVVAAQADPRSRLRRAGARVTRLPRGIFGRLRA